MPDILWPEDIVPFGCEFYLQAHSGGSESPFSRQSKVYGLSADRWVCSLTLRGGYSDEWGSEGIALWGQRLDALIAQMKGRQNRVALHDFRRPEMTGDWPSGVGNEAAPRGATVMTLTGLPENHYVHSGDYIGGDGRPHIIQNGGYAGEDGTVVIGFSPPLQSAVSEDGATFGNPTGLFRLVSDDAGRNGTEVGQLSHYTLEFVEDLGGEDGTLYIGDETVSASAFYFGGIAPEGSAYVRDHGTPANNYQGRFETWNDDVVGPVLAPGNVWAARNIVDESGTTVSTVDGQLPLDWSQGRRLLAIGYGDNFRIPKDVIPADTKTFWLRMKYVAGPSVGTYDGLFSIGGVSGEWIADCTIIDANLPEARIILSFAHGGVVTGALGRLSDLCADDGELLFVLSWSDLGLAVSVNGEPAAFYPRHLDIVTGFPDWDTIGIRQDPASGTKLYIESFGTLSRTLNQLEVSNKFCGAKLHPYMVAAMTMGDSHTGTGTGTERMPTLHLLARSSSYARLRGFHNQRDLSGSHIEGPRRYMAQTMTFDGAKFTSTTRRSTLEWQDPDNNFAAGYGWVAAEAAVQRTYGENQGRWIQIWEEIPGTSAIPGAIGTYEQDIKYRTSDDNMATWTAPAMALDASTLFGANALLATGCGGGVEFPADSAWPNRVMFPIYRAAPSAQVGVMWTDDDGASWGHTLWLSGFGGEEPNETTIALLPDDTIVLTHRIETDDVRFWSTSTDGGASFTNQGQMPDYEGAFTNAEMIQLDPEGLTGSRGLLAMMRAARSPGYAIPREGILLSFYSDAAMNPEDEAYVLARGRNYSYVNGIIPITIKGKRYWLFAVEGATNEYNYVTSSHVVAIRDPRDV